MPLQKRLPKYGFVSRISFTTAQVRLAELSKVDGDVVSLETLKAANVLNENVKRAKIFLSGEITKSFVVKGLTVTKGARQAIEAAGGKIEE